MRMQSPGIAMMALLMSSTAAHAADINLEATSVSKAGVTSFNVPTIVVTGADGRYTRVTTATLRFELSARIRKGEDFDRKVASFSPGSFKVGASGSDSKTLKQVNMSLAPGQEPSASLGTDWRKLSFVFEYQDPLFDATARRARDPVLLCNDLLRSKSGAAREQMLREGASLPLSKAYLWSGRFSYFVRTRGGQFDNAGDISTSGYFPASVRCQNLTGPAPRTQSQTKGPPPRPGRPLSETSPIKSATLRIEPSSQVVQAVPGQLCPTSLRIVATVAASREFRGRALVFGSGFLSPATPMQFATAGNRNFIVTYPLKWTGLAPPKKISGGPAPPPSALSQPAHLTLNVVDGDDKVVATSGRKTFDVVCKKMPPPGSKTQ
ncbi:MAG: hypothetical protein ABWY31_07840 [Pseudoxanthomonas sp.]